MPRLLTFAILLCAAITSAQTANNDQPMADQQGKKSKDQITTVGCLTKQNTDYVLIQTDPGNTYQLQATKHMHFKQYLGQQVEVTGEKVPSLATSSDYLAKSGVASPVTIIVDSIKSTEKRCSQ